MSVLLLGGTLHATAQDVPLRVMSYNVENLFDCRNDSLTDDEEYLPRGIRGWNYERYRTKLLHIAQVIAAIGQWDSPLLVGLCEIENRRCLQDLVYGPLQTYHYRYVHYESPDRRGIDVALLYDPNRLELLTHRALPVRFKQDTLTTTRDILYAKGMIGKRDTLHVYVCHFPSRSTGTLETAHRRMVAAQTLRVHLDSIQRADTIASVIIMGDFNDTPADRSLTKGLRAAYPTTLTPNGLYNLMYPLHEQQAGTHKHRGEWACLDQFIVSGALLDTTRTLHTHPTTVGIFDADFLLEHDAKALGVRPRRTYTGMKYTGGYSDHLPICMDLHLRK